MGFWKWYREHQRLKYLPCEFCGEKKVERHHIKGIKNDPYLVMYLCHEHHTLFHKIKRGLSKHRRTLKKDTKEYVLWKLKEYYENGKKPYSMKFTPEGVPTKGIL